MGYDLHIVCKGFDFPGGRQTIFFRQKDIQVGFITYNAKQDRLERVHGKGIDSFILKGLDAEDCSQAFCEGSYEKLIRDQGYFVVSDMDKYKAVSESHPLYAGLYEQGIRSAIFAPIAEEGEMLGVLEVVSGVPNALNGVNATKLDDVMPYIVSAVQRSKIEEENLIDAIIQHECTTVHDSVTAMKAMGTAQPNAAPSTSCGTWV